MNIKEKYQIDDNAWQKLSKNFKFILFGTPVLAFGFSFLTWPIIDGFSWTLVPIAPWAIVYLLFIFTYRSFFKIAKHTAFILALSALLVCFYFAVLGGVCVFRLFGRTGLLIQILLMAPIGVFIFLHYYKYWDNVW